MKKLFVSAAFLSAVLLSKAQSVDELAEKHTAAMGGKAALDKIKSVTMEGSMEVMTQKVDMKMVKVAGKLSRQDISVAGMNGYMLVTDTSGWMYMPFAGQPAPQALPEEALKSSRSELNIADGLVDYKSKGNRLELQGKEDVEGTDCYKLQLISAGNDTSTVYLDMKTYLINRTSTTKEMMGQKMDLTTDYSNYKDVEGVKFPFTVTTPQGTMNFSSIKLNQPVDAKMYSNG